MRPIILLLLLILAFSASAQDDIQLSGQILNANSRAVYLNYSTDLLGENQKRDSAVLDEQGHFTMTLPWTEAREATFKAGNEQTSLFLTPGDRLVLTLDTKEFDESLKYTGQGSTINSYLAQKILTEEKGKMRVMKAEAEYVKSADSARTAQQAVLTQHFQGRKPTKAETVFIEHEKENILYGWAQNRLMYPALHQYYNKLKEPAALSPNYYVFLKEVPVVHEQADVSSAYLSFAMSYARHLAAEQIKKQPALKARPFYLLAYEQAEKTFKGPAKQLVLTTLLSDAISTESNLSSLQPAYDRFLKEPGLEAKMRESMTRKWQQAERLSVGKAAPDFTAFTADGKPLKLSDLKGKVVFVDVWASWCGPCIQQVPAAKELETAFHGKDVVFLNVSIDDDQAAWKKALEKHGIQGVNVWSQGWKSEIAQKYSINGIPRYLLIDRQGNIISSNAERPSGGAKQAIADALAKK